MAIFATQYRIVRQLYEQGLLPQNGALLAIGDAQWPPGADALEMAGDIRRLATEPKRRDALARRIEELLARRDASLGFDLAQVYYELFFAPSTMQVVNFERTGRGPRRDLNRPLSLDRRFEVVFDQQAAARVFNIGQVFKTIHQYTAPQGLMIHECPFTGCIDQGYFTLQPTLFFDVAETNDYRLAALFIEDVARGLSHQITKRDEVYELAASRQIPDNALLFAVLTKSAVEREFVYPMQGYYNRSLGEAGKDAWFQLR
jgi:hypothetical protein